MADDGPAGILYGDDVIGEQLGSLPEKLGCECRLAAALVGDEGDTPWAVVTALACSSSKPRYRLIVHSTVSRSTRSLTGSGVRVNAQRSRR